VVNFISDNTSVYRVLESGTLVPLYRPKLLNASVVLSPNRSSGEEMGLDEVANGLHTRPSSWSPAKRSPSEIKQLGIAIAVAAGHEKRQRFHWRLANFELRHPPLSIRSENTVV